MDDSVPGNAVSTNLPTPRYKFGVEECIGDLASTQRQKIPSRTNGHGPHPECRAKLSPSVRIPILTR